MARRTHCPAGRVLYRVGDIPPHLATATMLSRLRRSVAPGQQPVASLLYRGNKYTGLYEIAASTAPRDQTPAQAARSLAARTCHRCTAVSGNPYPLNDSGARTCPPCHRVEDAAVRAVDASRQRYASRDWARQLLLAAPGTAVIIAARTVRGIPVISASGFPVWLAAVDVTTGDTLLHAVIRPHRPAPDATVPSDAVDLDDVAVQLQALADRRVIRWGAYPLHWAYERGAVRNVPAYYLAPDDLSYRHRCWRGHARHKVPLPDVRGTDPAEQLLAVRAEARWMLADIWAIAADVHPDGPLTCPVLPATGVVACGADDVGPAGVCPDHDIEVPHA